MLKFFRLAIVPVTLVGLACAGCSSSDSTAATGMVEPPQDVGQPAISPVESEKSARWKAAIRGLSFETGRVVVDARSRRNESASRQAFEAGRITFGRNDFVGAVGEFRDALTHDPDFIEGYLALADALHMKGEAGMAIAGYRTVLDARPDDADTRCKLAMELWSGSGPEAIAEMNRVVELDPTRADAYERLAIWNYYAGDYAEAWRHVHQTRALGADVPPQFIPLLSGQMADPGPGIG